MSYDIGNSLILSYPKKVVKITREERIYEERILQI